MSYFVCCSAGNIDMLPTEGFLVLKKESLLQNTVDNDRSVRTLASFSTRIEKRDRIRMRTTPVVRIHGCPY